MKENRQVMVGWMVALPVDLEVEWVEAAALLLMVQQMMKKAGINYKLPYSYQNLESMSTNFLWPYFISFQVVSK